jgi:hypothetical protein
MLDGDIFVSQLMEDLLRIPTPCSRPRLIEGQPNQLTVGRKQHYPTFVKLVWFGNSYGICSVNLSGLKISRCGFLVSINLAD